MNDPHTWQEIVGWALIYTAVAWMIIFAMRFVLIAPFNLFREQKDRIDRLEGLQQLEGDTQRLPSFNLGFEFLRFDESDYQYKLYAHHPLCRIWIENLESRAISDCRIVVESFSPDSPIKNGVLLLSDQRGSDEKPTAEFDLAPTERRYFKFIEVEQTFYSQLEGKKEWEVVVRSDQDRTGFASVNDKKCLAFGKHYLATITAHGKNAGSRRLNLEIDVVSETEVVIVEMSNSK